MLKDLKGHDISDVIEACETLNKVSAEKGFGGAAAPDTTAVDIDALLAEDWARKRLYDLLYSLSKEALLELVALMWTGRGDGRRSFAENLDYAKQSHDKGTVSYLAQKSSSLPAYLRKGLEGMSGTP